MDFVVSVNQSIINKNLSALEALIESNADWILISHQQSPTFFMLASYYGNHEAAMLLKNKGYSLDLFEAAVDGDLDTVKRLVNGDAGLVNSFSADGFPLLGLACFFNRKNVADFLLTHGADVNAQARNPQKVGPIHSAVAANSTDLVDLLLQYNVDVNAKQQAGFTALHAAAQNGNFGMVKRLIDHGADIHAAAQDGSTALTLAEQGKDTDLIDLLKGLGASHD